MPTRSLSSLLGVLFGFLCVFPLLMKRRKKEPRYTAEALLQQATSEMKVAQARNRERAVQAITQKNHLQALVDQTRKQIERLTERADAADSPEDRQDFLAQRDRFQASLAGMLTALTSSIGAAEAVKIAMRREEEHVRTKTAEALALRATEKQAQIEFEIEKSRLGMTTTKAGELFERAQAKIQQAQARRDLMAQLRKTSEVLEEAAEAAAREGDTALSRRLLSERDELKKAGLNPNLWRN